MYSVHQHWDPLKVCAVGQSYPPEFYSFIKNSHVRKVMERIAEETEEDYQKLINVLLKFNVQIVRPNLGTTIENFWDGTKYMPPPMCPRDYGAMVGSDFHFSPLHNHNPMHWNSWAGVDWPPRATNRAEFDALPLTVKQEIKRFTGLDRLLYSDGVWDDMISLVKMQGNTINSVSGVNTATTTRVGRDLYVGTSSYADDVDRLHQQYSELFPEYRCWIVNSGGHLDGSFCPVVPGLIVSLYDLSEYEETFPGWEVIYLKNQSWEAVRPFLDLKSKNRGKWWVPGEELNDDFTNFINSWLDHWTGYVEETVFDVNMLVIDRNNVICNNYNKEVFDAFERHGVTPHIVNFRHRYFWDGGIHCVTLDLDRDGPQEDYFPNRG